MAETLEKAFVTELVRVHEDDDFFLSNVIPEEETPFPSAEWDELIATRTRAQHRAVGTAAGDVALRTRKQHSSPYAYIREKKKLTAKTMYHLRRPGTEAEQYAEEAVADEAWDLKDICKRAPERDVALMLLNGKITITGEQVNFEIDFGRAVGNMPTTSTSWATIASADVIGDINAWKKVARQGGIKPAEAIFSTTVESYMLGNTAVQSLIRSQWGYEMATSGKLPPQLCGLNLNVYEDGDMQGGTWAEYMTADKFVITPSFSDRRWWRMLMGPSGDTEAEGASGWFGKIYKDDDPSGIFMVVDLCYLPILKIPNVTVCADVIP